MWVIRRSLYIDKIHKVIIFSPYNSTFVNKMLQIIQIKSVFWDCGKKIDPTDSCSGLHWSVQLFFQPIKCEMCITMRSWNYGDTLSYVCLVKMLNKPILLPVLFVLTQTNMEIHRKGQNHRKDPSTGTTIYVANIQVPEQTPRSVASDLGLRSKFRYVCPNSASILHKFISDRKAVGPITVRYIFQ